MPSDAAGVAVEVVEAAAPVGEVLGAAIAAAEAAAGRPIPTTAVSAIQVLLDRGRDPLRPHTRAAAHRMEAGGHRMVGRHTPGRRRPLTPVPDRQPGREGHTEAPIRGLQRHPFGRAEAAMGSDLMAGPTEAGPTRDPQLLPTDLRTADQSFTADPLPDRGATRSPAQSVRAVVPR